MFIEKFAFMKYFIFLLFVCIPFTFFSCATSNPVYTTVSEDGGQLYFLRPITLKSSHAEISLLDLDVTVRAAKDRIFQNPTLNYTLTMPLEHANLADEIRVNIVTQNLVVKTESISQLFRNTDGKKYMDIRYSAQLNKDDFMDLLNSGESCLIQVVGADGSVDLVDSDDFNLRIGNLRLMML